MAMRKVLNGLVLLAAVAAVQGFAHAETAASVAASVAAPAANPHLDACDDLAGVVVDEGRTLSSVDRFMESVGAAMKPGDGSIGDIEVKFPGLKPKVLAGMRPLMLRNAQATLPLYRADLAALYCANLSTAEARQAAIAMRKPAFQAFIAKVMGGANYDGIAKTAYGQNDVTAKDVSSAQRTTGMKVAKTLTPAETASIIAFLRSPAGRKLAAVGQQKAAIDAKWFNYSTPEHELEMGQLVSDTIAAHVALTDPAVAARMKAAMEKGLAEGK